MLAGPGAAAQALLESAAEHYREATRLNLLDHLPLLHAARGDADGLPGGRDGDGRREETRPMSSSSPLT